MSQTSKQRAVRQLLRDYRDWHTAYGGATEINLAAMGQFGPAGMLAEGMAFRKKDYYRLKTSYEFLEAALTLLKIEHFSLWMSLLEPYLGDPADPSVVEDWKEKAQDVWEGKKLVRRGYISAQLFLKREEEAVKKLAHYLRKKELYHVQPKRMTTRRTVNVAERNDEFWGLYKALRADGLGKTKAVNDAAQMCQYGLTRAWDIVKLRESEENKCKAS